MNQDASYDRLIQHILGGSADETTVFAHLRSDVDLDTPNASAMTATKAAVINGSVQVLRLLLLNGAAATQELIAFAEQRYAHKGEILAVLHEAGMHKAIGDPGAGVDLPRQRRSPRVGI